MVVPYLSETGVRSKIGGTNRGEGDVSETGKLLDRACHLRKHYTRVEANHAHYANYKPQYHCQHDRVLSHILTFRVAAEPNQKQTNIQTHSVFYYALASKQNE